MNRGDFDTDHHEIGSSIYSLARLILGCFGTICATVLPWASFLKFESDKFRSTASVLICLASMLLFFSDRRHELLPTRRIVLEMVALHAAMLAKHLTPDHHHLKVVMFPVLLQLTSRVYSRTKYCSGFEDSKSKDVFLVGVMQSLIFWMPSFGFSILMFVGFVGYRMMLSSYVDVDQSVMDEQMKLHGKEA